MDEPFEYEITEGPTRIIKRPRLTRMLDGTDARILMLIAPAGYGKTTLARQWVTDREGRHGWYTGGPAAADVAALCVELATAASAVVPDAGNRLRDRLSVTDAPEREVRILAELLAEDLVDWPKDAVLAFDDYHYAMERPAAEEFVELLLELAPIRLLLASRHRPTWATARRVLYGEIFELRTGDLSMTTPEVTRVVRVEPSGKLNRILGRAQGWPAVIALVANSSHTPLIHGEPSTELFDYFADELFRELPEHLRNALCQLSLAATLDLSLYRFLFGQEADALLEQCIQAGFVTRIADRSLALHPLLRDFLRARLWEEDEAVFTDAARTIAQYALQIEDWDLAFSIAKDLHDAESLHDLLQSALESLLAQGRIATLEQWLAYADQRSFAGPVVQLARAHIHQRRGLAEPAEMFAVKASVGLHHHALLHASALLVAARGAHFTERFDVALDYLQEAKRLTNEPNQRREIAWLAFVTALESETFDYASALDDFLSLDDHSTEHMLRVAHAELIISIRTTGLTAAIERHSTLIDLHDAVHNPTVRTGYLQNLAMALNTTGRYQEAAVIAKRELDDATRSKLAFVLPYAWHNRALAAYGQRRFRDAREMLEKALRHANATANIHAEASSRITLAHLFLAQGAVERASQAVEFAPSRAITLATTAELEGTRALILAFEGRHDEALKAVASAQRTTNSTEAHSIALWAHAASSSVVGEAAVREVVERAAKFTQETGNVHSFVVAYRAHPVLLRLASDVIAPAALARIVANAGDQSLGRSVGLSITTSSHPKRLLTRREREVYDLLCEGRSNIQIGRALFIAESTVKVHLRHIFEKLGVRTRTEAVAKGLPVA